MKAEPGNRERIMRRTDENRPEKLKTRSVKILIRKKVFYKSRISGKVNLSVSLISE